MIKMSKKGVVVSGGGAWGAFGAGTLAGLNRKYDIGTGISTGALMTPFVMLNDYDRLREAYTSVTDKDIFDLAWYRPRPIKKNGKVNMWAIIYALILGKESFGTTKQMRKLIDKFFTSIDYANVLREKKEVLVGCQNFQEDPSDLHYFSTAIEKYEDFKDWMWFSANATFATSLVQKEWTPDPLFPNKKYMGQWSDGGITEVIPLDPMFKKGVTEIDVIIHRPQPKQKYQTGKIKNLIEYVEGGIDAMRHDITFEHLFESCQHMAEDHGVTSRLYFLPRKLNNNSMVFRKDEMLMWWKEGFETCNDPERIVEFKP